MDEPLTNYDIKNYQKRSGSKEDLSNTKKPLPIDKLHKPRQPIDQLINGKKQPVPKATEKLEL